MLDDSRPPCSVRTMYWILDRHDEVKERRNQPQHSACANQELIAEGPNQGWSWYIPKLKEGTAKLVYFYLYVIIDILSWYVVGWMVAPRELAVLAKSLIEQSYGKQGFEQDQLSIHSDRGPSMTSKSVALLLADLGNTKSLSRSHVINGNLYSESQFKTLKYRPEFPERFKGGMPKPTAWPFPHLSGSTNRRFPKVTRRYRKFLPEVFHFD
jgi:putative transposase